MAPSQVSGMKMRNLLFGVVLGLLAVVHSTPVDTVIQVPAKTEDDVIQEAQMDGYLIDHSSSPLLTTKSPKRNTTVQASQQTSSDSESVMIEGSGMGTTLVSGEGEHYATTTQSVSHAQSSTSTVLPRDTDDSGSDSSTTQDPLSSFTSSPVPYEGEPKVFPDHISVSQTTMRLETSDESTTSVFLQHGGEHYATTTPSVSHAQSSTSTVLPRDTDDSSLDSSTTQSPQSSFTSSPVPYEGEPNVFPDHISVSQTTMRLDTSDESTTSVFLQHGGEHYATTTLSVSHAQSSTSTAFPRDTDDSSLDSSTTQSPQSSFTSSPVPNEGQPDITPDHISVSQTTDPASSSMTSSSNTQTSTASSTSMAALFSPGSELGSGMQDSAEIQKMSQPLNNELGSGMQDSAEIQKMLSPPLNNGLPNKAETVIPASHQNKGHSTPGWIIILGFIVGLAALVVLCVAIATRDKWNGPNQASQLETKTNSSNQQRELEMETFLHKDNPRENGKAAEYTVIPLDELPEKYSSH